VTEKKKLKTENSGWDHWWPYHLVWSKKCTKKVGRNVFPPKPFSVGT